MGVISATFEEEDAQAKSDGNSPVSSPASGPLLLPDPFLMDYDFSKSDITFSEVHHGLGLLTTVMVLSDSL